MAFKSFLEKNRDSELYWETQEASWLSKLKASPLYEDLKLQYDNETLDKNLEMLAAHRTRVYRTAPGILLQKQKEKSAYIPDAFRLFAAVQSKKLFNLVMEWRAEKVRLPGIWHPWQIRTLEGQYWSTRFIPAFGEEDLSFLKKLLTNDAFIAVREWRRYGHTMDTSAVRDYMGSGGMVEVLEEYPLIYKMYDAYFDTGHVLHYPNTKEQKWNAIRDIYHKLHEGEHEPWVDPEPGKEYYLEVDKYSGLEREYFLAEEPQAMQQLLDAHDLFYPDGWTSDEMEYETAKEELVKARFSPYPRADVPWLDATVMAGRALFFENVRNVLDEAFAEYKWCLAKGILPKTHHDKEDVYEVLPVFMEQFTEVQTHLGLSTNPDDIFNV